MYWSERAQIVSCPHGFGTRVTGTRPDLGRAERRFAAERDLVAFPAVFFFGMRKYLR